MGAHGRHFGSENAGGAIEGGKGLVELGHVAADGGLPLHQVNVLPRIGHGQRGVDSGDAAAHHQDVRVDGHAAALQGFVLGHAPHRRAHQVFGLERGLDLVLVHPGSLLPDVDHVKEKRIQAAHLERRAEGVLVEVRRAGRHHHAIQLVVADVLADEVLAGV